MPIDGPAPFVIPIPSPPAARSGRKWPEMAGNGREIEKSPNKPRKENLNRMNDLRRRVNALRRKMARALAVVRLRPLAREFCDQWDSALSGSRPLPEAHSFIRRVAQAGFRLTTFMAAHRYLERCRRQNALPGCHELVRSLLPWSAALVPAG